MKFLIYFEIYGKKMKTEVEADNKQEARDVIRSALIFHKIEQFPEQENDIVKKLQKMMGIND